MGTMFIDREMRREKRDRFIGAGANPADGDGAAFSLTPRFSGVIAQTFAIPTVSTVFRNSQCINAAGLMGKTVETVWDVIRFEITPLKRGVNQSRVYQRAANNSIQPGVSGIELLAIQLDLCLSEG